MKSWFKLIVIILSVAVIESCKNNDNVLNIPSTFGYFKVINATTTALNIFLNGTRQNNGTTLNPGGAAFYLQTPVGQQNFEFKKNNTSTILFGYPLKVENSVNYSLYIYGTGANDHFGAPDALPNDTVTADTTANIRFVHVSPGTVNLDVYINGDLIFKNQEFTKISEFRGVPNGLNRVRVFQIGVTDTTKKLVDTTFQMDSRNDYTIYTHGIINGIGTAKFNIGFTLNAQPTN